MKRTQDKRAVIVGATSGIGYETAMRLLKKGWKLGIAGRRIGKLKEIQAISPNQIVIRRIDICQENAENELLQLIGELENNKRGIYGGAIGYIDFTGNMDTCIAIRIAYKKNGRVFVRSGAGIVADSVPEKEYQECINKAGAVMDALRAAEEVDL